MHRYLALDIGLKRTGIALVDDEVKVATPLSVIARAPGTPEFIRELMVLIDEWESVALIIGLPIDLKGKEAIAAHNVRKVADEIISCLEGDFPVYFVDERLTTAQVEKAMKTRGVSAAKRKELRDALAAAQIAQSFIDSI